MEVFCLNVSDRHIFFLFIFLAGKGFSYYGNSIGYCIRRIWFWSVYFCFCYLAQIVVGNSKKSMYFSELLRMVNVDEMDYTLTLGSCSGVVKGTLASFSYFKLEKRFKYLKIYFQNPYPFIIFSYPLFKKMNIKIPYQYCEREVELLVLCS